MERLSTLYATALFELALENGKTDEFLEQAILIRDTLQDEQCRRILVHPHIPAAEKKQFFAKAYAGHIHDDLLGFLFLVADKNREAYMLPALTSLIGMIERHNGKVAAKIYYATSLEKEKLEVMKKILSKKLDKKVDVTLIVDPTIIGGPYIFVDGYYLDWTVKKRLRDLTVHMKEGCSA